MIDKAKMLKTRPKNILTHLTHGIANATRESIRAKIQWVKYTARGFRNLENFKNAICRGRVTAFSAPGGGATGLSLAATRPRQGRKERRFRKETVPFRWRPAPPRPRRSGGRTTRPGGPVSQ